MEIIRIIQIATAISLIIVILLQNKGTGLGGAFGGGNNVYLTKRGLEKKLFVATIILATIFLLVSLAIIIL